MMYKKVYKIFINFLEGQEKWLNEMSLKGYKLIKANRWSYEFEQCESDEYKYTVEFVINKTNKDLQDYKRFLSEIGINFFGKNINIGKYSVGEVKIRPYIKGTAAIATNPGKINNELLILEKKNDKKPFKLHSSLKEVVAYFRNIRNTFLFTDAFITIFFILLQYNTKNSNFTLSIIKILSGLLIIYLTTNVYRYSKFIRYYKEKEKIYE